MENLKILPANPCDAAQEIIFMLSEYLLPSIQELYNKIIDDSNFSNNNSARKRNRSSFLLCCNQISKTVISLVKVFKTEFSSGIIYEDTRQFLVDRLQFCVQKLPEISRLVDKLDDNTEYIFEESHLFGTSFIQWLDDVFDLLGDLANTFSNDDGLEQFSEANGETWRSQCKNEIAVLCGALNEMLLAAMTLNQCCKPDDQKIVKVRCQVVLRESRNLLMEILDADDVKLDDIGDVKLKQMPHFTSVKIAIDVLKESLYTLEKSVNNAILSIILECFREPQLSPNLLNGHLLEGETCDCLSANDETECLLVKRCDILFDRIIEVGLFAATCSTDEKKILPLKSSLTSLEALEQHLIPSIMSASQSFHSAFLCDLWNSEVDNIKNLVYLIVDPVPMVELSCEILQVNIMSIQESEQIDADLVDSSIGIGKICEEFFQVYFEKEPAALEDILSLKSLISDLAKAVRENQAYWNMINQTCEVKNDPKLMKRLKLIYTLLKRILNCVKHTDKDDNFFSEEHEMRSTITVERNHNKFSTFTKDMVGNRKGFLANLVSLNTASVNKTHTKVSKNKDKQSFIQSLSIRLENVRNERMKLCTNSIEIDTILKMDSKGDRVKDHYPTPFRCSKRMMLYSFGKAPSRKEVPLREQMFRSKYGSMNNGKSASTVNRTVNASKMSGDSTMNLQITEILDQLTDLSSTLTSFHKFSKNSSKAGFYPISVVKIDFESNGTESVNEDKENECENILKFNVNEDITEHKDSWSIKIKSEENSSVDISVQKHQLSLSDVGIDVSFGSDVDTPQRVSDLKFLEDKLASLKHADNRKAT